MVPASRPDHAAGNRWTAPLCHEEVFVRRYQSLRGWALRLAGNVTDADDLLHDAFLQFVVRRRELTEVDNVDGYLYGLLRRLCLSKRRASLRAREDPLPALEYDTAELSLRAADPRDLLRLQDELRQVCAYACRRKESSKSGSVLLLRFFLGFFPGEIARILNCPLRGANDWLRIARREARAHLAAPPAAIREVAPLRTALPAASGKLNGNGAGPPDPLEELRAMIWASRRGDCLTTRTLAQAYGTAGTATLSCGTLAHLVSCRECLARVTSMLGMREPTDRDPHEMLGPDTSWRFGREASGSGAGPSAAQMRRWEGGLRELREHAPRELRIVANGFPLAACTVNATDCAFTIAVNIDEPLDFIEVFSEQGVRLLLFAIEPPPAGDVDQADGVELEGGRSLSASVRFDAHWPSLEIGYRDPAWTPEPEAAAPGRTDAPVLAFVRPPDVPATPSIWERCRELIGTLGSGTIRWGALRPALAGVALVAALGVFAKLPWRTEPVSAAQILSRARTIEAAATSRPDLVVHRVLQLEERRLPDRVVRMRRRVEGWHSGRRGVTMRRVYDERGRLITADAVRSDGTRTVYAAGQAPRVAGPGELPVLASATVWQWEPSAAAFERLGEVTSAAAVRDEGDRYVLTYDADLDAGADGLVEATLVVAKHPLRPIAQTLVIREGGVAREFHFAETRRAEIPESNVPETRFQPDPELLPPPEAPAARPLERPAAVPKPIVDARAVNRLEVDLLFTLHRLETCLEAPAEIASGANGPLAVTARADAGACRDRVRQAVDSQRDGDLRASIRFVPPPPHASSSVDVTAAQLEALPAYRTLIARFAAAGLQNPQGPRAGDDAAAIAARAFGTWALEHARRAHEEVLHLDGLTSRWSVEALAALDVDRVARWQDVVRDHARRLRRESEALRVQLGSLLARAADPPAHDPRDGTIAVHGPEQVRPAVVRLLELAAAHHDAVRQLLDPALTTPRVPVDVAALAASLQRAEAQAAWFDEPWAFPSPATLSHAEPLAHKPVTAR